MTTLTDHACDESRLSPTTLAMSRNFNRPRLRQVAILIVYAHDESRLQSTVQEKFITEGTGLGHLMHVSRGNAPSRRTLRIAHKIPTFGLGLHTSTLNSFFLVTLLTSSPRTEQFFSVAHEVPAVFYHAQEHKQFLLGCPRGDGSFSSS